MGRCVQLCGGQGTASGEVTEVGDFGSDLGEVPGSPRGTWLLSRHSISWAVTEVGPVAGQDLAWPTLQRCRPAASAQEWRRSGGSSEFWTFLCGEDLDSSGPSHTIAVAGAGLGTPLSGTCSPSPLSPPTQLVQ